MVTLCVMIMKMLLTTCDIVPTSSACMCRVQHLTTSSFYVGRDSKTWCLYGTEHNTSINSSADAGLSAEPSACAGHTSPLPHRHPRPHCPDPCHSGASPTTADSPTGAPPAPTPPSPPACAEPSFHHRGHPTACEGECSLCACVWPDHWQVPATCQLAFPTPAT